MVIESARASGLAEPDPAAAPDDEIHAFRLQRSLDCLEIAGMQAAVAGFELAQGRGANGGRFGEPRSRPAQQATGGATLGRREGAAFSLGGQFPRPTGRLECLELIERAPASNPNPLVVVDESNAEGNQNASELHERGRSDRRPSVLHIRDRLLVHTCPSRELQLREIKQRPRRSV
jgi:hypothetical protein